MKKIFQYTIVLLCLLSLQNECLAGNKDSIGGKVQKSSLLDTAYVQQLNKQATDLIDKNTNQALTAAQAA